ncbi:MAG: cytochrome c, partial [Candidatus Kapabacteria bacterium]|nr:cytochrome c [Candidatus Kapabacteria bacterium]MDW7997079.1 cytochrome c [Bacteroidota bacterium]
MRLYGVVVLFSFVFLLGGCGGEKPEQPAERVGEAAASSAEAPAVAGVPTEVMQRGKQVYDSYCKTCHQANGQGIPGV